MIRLALALGAAVGIVLGLTGAGGSVIAVPLLMAGFGWSLPQAAPVALIAVAASAAFGAYGAWRRGIVRYRAAGLMGLAGILVSPFGLWASWHLPVAALSLLFAGVMTVVALRMLRQSLRLPAEAQVVRAALGGEPAADSRWCRLNPDTGRLIWSPATWLLISAVGIGTGFLSGLLGVGGGFVIVPSLRALTPLSMQSAVATSLMTIAIIATGTVGWSAFGGAALPWAAAAPFAGGAVGGMLLARRAAARMAGAHLEQGFAALLLIVAGGLAAHTLKIF